MIRLTLILSAVIVGGMTAFGQDRDGVAPEPIGVERLAPSLAARVEAAPAAAEPIPAEVFARAIHVAAVTPAKPRLTRVVASDAPRGRRTAMVIAPHGAAGELLYVTGSRVNLRAGPSTRHEVLGRLRQGDAAELLEALPGGWMMIRTARGRVGFMSGAYLAPRYAGN